MVSPVSQCCYENTFDTRLKDGVAFEAQHLINI
jgi:apolipoprotein N-acyltransferase